MQRILSLVRRCVEDYHMIESGDTVAVGVSGGKDSVLTLAALLVNYPQALQFGCTRRRGLLLQAGLLGAQYLATVPLVAAALLLRGLRPRRAPGTKAGLYAEKAGLVSGKLGPRKPACIKAFPWPFGGGAYHFTSCPCFRLILSTFYSLRGGYYGRKSRLCHPAVHSV